MGLIITLGGPPGSGKSTIGRMLAARLDLPYFYIGNIRRQYALERGMNLEELNRRSLNDPASDKLADEYQAELPKRYGSFVLDAKLGYHFIPQSVKVYIDVDLRLGAERIFLQHRPEENWASVDEGTSAIQERMRNDQQRYQHLYQTDCYDKRSFDKIFDGGKEAEAVVEEIIAYLEEKGIRVPE